MSDEHENGEEQLIIPGRGRLTLPNAAKLPLDGGNYAVLEHGIIQIYLKDEKHLFSVDANTIPFERKTLGAALQIYLLGFQSGRNQERVSAKQRVISAINLLFE